MTGDPNESDSDSEFFDAVESHSTDQLAQILASRLANETRLSRQKASVKPPPLDLDPA